MIQPRFRDSFKTGVKISLFGTKFFQIRFFKIQDDPVKAVQSLGVGAVKGIRGIENQFSGAENLSLCFDIVICFSGKNQQKLVTVMVVQWTGRPVMQRTTSPDTYNIRTKRIKKSCGGWLKGINFFSGMKKPPLKSFTLKISYHTILDCCMKKCDK